MGTANMAIYNVSNSSQLQSALGKAIGGDRIVLASGNYGDVRISNRNYASNVTLDASSLDNRAHFDGLFVSNSKNLTFSGLDLGRGIKSGEVAEWKQLNSVYRSTNITFDNVEFHGSEDNNPKNDGVGIVATEVNGFRIENSDFSELFRGVSVQRSSNVSIASNKFENLRSDGVTVASTVGITIDGNTFQDFRPKVGDHADGIQFWNTGQSKGSSDITIQNNVMWFPEINPVPQLGMQGIFLGDPKSYGYKNVSIENNLIYSNDAWNGLAVAGADGLRVVGNSVLSTSEDSKSSWIRLENSKSVVMQNNVTDDMRLTGLSGLTQSNNLNLAAQPNMKSLFADLDSPDGIADLLIASGGFQVVGAPAPAPAPTPTPTPAPTPTPTPEPAPAPSPAPTEVSKIIYGTTGYDTIRGTSADEMIYGIAQVDPKLGQGTRDTLYGGGGADIFVLADSRGLFYDDKMATSSGRADHAVIRDFGSDDKIQLTGQMSDYFTHTETINGIKGLSLFHDTNGSGRLDYRDEYIAHISGSPTALALTADHFIFVSDDTTIASAAPPPTGLASGPVEDGGSSTSGSLAPTSGGDRTYSSGGDDDAPATEDVSWLQDHLITTDAGPELISFGAQVSKMDYWVPMA